MNSSKVRRLRHWLSRERLTSIKGFPLAFVLRNPPKLYPLDLQVVAEKMNENFPSPLPAGEFWGARGGSHLLCSSHTLCLFYTKRLDDPRHLLPIIVSESNRCERVNLLSIWYQRSFGSYRTLWFICKYTALMNLHRLQNNFCILALVLFLLHVANYLYQLNLNSFRW